MRASMRDWMFRVQASGLEKNDVVFVVGNVPELGSWNHNNAIQLAKESEGGDESPRAFDAGDNADFGDCFGNSPDAYEARGESNDINSEEKGQIFSEKIALPSDTDIQFRYFIAVICHSNCSKNSLGTLMIRKWETHIMPRQIKKDVPRNFTVDSLPDPEVFGYHNGYSKIERGWLTEETLIQFKLFNNPIKLWKSRLQDKKIHIKMTPVNLVRHSSVELPQFGSDCIDDSLSMDTQDVVDQPAFSITEIAVMNDQEASFRSQEQFGRAYNEDEFMVFSVAVQNPEIVAYLIDYYVYSSRSFPGEPPTHIGFSYILPSTLQASTGLLTVPMTSTKHRPIGQLTVEYVSIKPIPEYPWEMSISYAKHWEQRWAGIDVAHRGLGNSFSCLMKNCANVRENTIASLKTAAYHGADMVEFDVQLSKDMVPVIYHDFYVSISLKRKKQVEGQLDMLEIPVKDLTLEQLHLLKVYHVAEGRDKNPRFFDEDLEDHQPFPTLHTVLQALEQHVGCNIEIKWTMQLKDGTYELNHPFDLNTYLDIILKVVLEHGGSRKVVFSSFHPDICAMMRLKQNKYPVVFLTQGITTKYPTYHDPRCQNIPMAIRHALVADLLGINVHTEDILRDPSQVKLVKDAGLIVFCWGDDNNDKDTIKHLKKLGLHAVIYDKMDEYNTKEVKESVFLVDARENEKALIALAQSNQTSNTTLISSLKPLMTNDASSATGNESDDSACSCVLSSVENNHDAQDKDMIDLTKNFSICANSLCRASKIKNPSNCNNQQMLLQKNCSIQEESLKNCL